MYFGFGSFFAICPLFRRKRYSPAMLRVYPRCRSFTQNTTSPALGFRRRISPMSLIVRSVLVRVTVRATRAIYKRFERPVVAFQPAVDILSVRPIADGCFRDTVLLCIASQRLPIQGGLCYLTCAANRVPPAFAFVGQLNLNTEASYSLLFISLLVTHHCKSYSLP